MSNELSILGFGECGSKIAVEISASFNPTNILKGESPLAFCFKYFSSKLGRERKPEIGQSPAFYIADLNTSNDVYIFFTKAQAIRDSLVYANESSPVEIISKINKNQDKVLLEEGDIEIIEQVKRQKEALKMVNALYFEANNKPLLGMGGAGGLQYLSEAIASKDTNVMRSIDKRVRGALIGIFSLGGGTGSGSLYSILTNYKNTVHRYTVGVGVLPERQNIKQFVNAGRYLTKYLGAKKKDRFHTLLLFSNEAARDVLIEEKNLEDSADPMSIINNYISSFVHDFSMINDQKTISRFGKLFDPMDAKRFLSGVCTVGFSSNDKFSAKSLFTKAISPLHYENDQLGGIAIRLTRGEHDVSQERAIREKLSTCIDKIDNDNLDTELISDIRKCTPFYRSIKSVLVFFFIKNSAYQADAYRFQKTISRLFKSISGDHISVEVNCYYTPESESRQNSVLVMFNGAFNYEIYDSMLDYAKHSFIRKGDVQPDFEEKFNSVLKNSGTKRIDDLDEELSTGIGEVLVDTNCQMVEDTDVQETMDLLNHSDVRAVINAEVLEKILIKKDTLRAALVEVIRQFALGENKKLSKVNPFDDFEG